MRIYERTQALIGHEGINKLAKANICIIGIGGVGSYTLEALARVGILNVTIIDKDVVDESNINRQLLALSSTIGKYKVEVAKTRLLDINKDINCKAFVVAINKENVGEYITNKYHYVIDAIDDVDAKVAVIKKCRELNIPVISSMGMAQRVRPTMICVEKISKTQMCPLAKIMRKRLREEGINDVKVVYSKEQPIKNSDGVLGSISYLPSTAGLIIASEVVTDILEQKA